MSKYKECSFCGSMFENRSYHKSRKYCNSTCSARARQKAIFESGNGSVRNARKYLISIIEYKCSVCGQGEIWNGKELTLHMDHIDGDTKNNSINNLRLLCPNCHQQTETWGVGNVSDEGRVRLRTNVRD